MAEKLPSPPLTGIATKVVGESPEDRVKGVLKSEYAYLRENLSIDSEVAAKLFGWSPQLLGDPPYREILSFNERGKHFDAFERWYQFAESSYTEDRLKVFCECLAEIGSPTRPKLVEVGRRVFEMLVGEQMSGHGPSEHTDESGPSPSQLKSNEANVKVNPNPFLPPQFPPTGSSAAQGPSSQLLLGPSSGMPLPMPLQVPGAFPPGMGVPPGFGSQLMSVLQSLLGIPPTSTVSLAPSVSTEQRKDGENLKEVERTAAKMRVVRKLVLRGPSDYMTAVLHGVAASATIEDLKVEGLLSPDGGEHDVAEALAKCVVNPKLRIVETWSLPPLTVMKGLTTREVPLEELVISPIWRGDGEDLKEVERTAAKMRVVKKLVLLGPSNYMTAVLHGVAASATIEDLKVQGHPDDEEHDVAEALAKCVFNSKLRRVEMEDLPALPVMKALTTREVPLEELVIKDPPWGRGTVFSEDHLKEMERSAAKIRVRKVIFDVDYNTALHDAVSSGLGENKCLQDVTLRCVPEEKKQFVRSKLSAGHETDLLNQCWIPFGIESLLVTKEGGIFPLEPLTPEHRDDINRTFRMEVPANAIRSDTLEVMYGIILDGPFVLPRGYRFASPLVYVCFDESKVIKPLKIHIPHWIAQAKDHSEDDVLFIISPHSISEGEQMYKFTAMESRCTSTVHDVYGTVEISGHNSLVGQAMEEKIPSCYYASSWERMDGDKRYLRVAIMYCIPLWLKVLEEYWSAEAWKCSDKVRQSFEVTGDSMEGKLRSSHGPGWEARLNQLAINTKFVAYDSYKRENLESAVKINLYPPCFLVEVLQTVSPSVNVVPRFLHLDIMGTTSKELYFSIEVNEEAVDNAGNPSCNVQLSSPTPENMSFSSPQRPPFHELSPSDIGLSGTLKAIPCWQRLAVNLGVSVDQVQAFQSDPLGDLLALKYWRDGNCGQMFPTTWRFLLQTIEHTIRKKVAKDLEKMASREPTWSQ